MLIPAMTWTMQVNLPRELVSQVFVRKLGVDALAIMRRRVQEKGHNLQDVPMAPYAKMTRDQRRKRGRQSSFRDLTFTGRMMGDLHVAHVRREGAGYAAVIGFATGHSRILAAKHQVRDPWFGFSKNDERILSQLIARQLPVEMQKQFDAAAKKGGK